jgi:Pre-mRNA 3'-end-processing endonuclease polyadenylation factor C-term
MKSLRSKFLATYSCRAYLFPFSCSQVKVTVGATPGVATVEWEATPQGDVVADAVVGLLMHAQSSAASIRLTSKPCRHPRDDSVNDDQAPKKPRADETSSTESRLRFIYGTLKDQFENVEAVYEGDIGTYEITTDSGHETGVADDDGMVRCSVKVEFVDAYGTNAKISVECKDQKLGANVQECLRNVATAMAPIKI